MKAKQILFMSALTMLTFTACGGGDDEPAVPKQEETPKIEINTSQSSPVLDQQGGTATVSFTATAAWTAEVAAATRALDWCSVSPTRGEAGSATLTITTKPNDTYDERRATITLRSGTTSKNFTVTQKQKDALTVTSNKIEVDAAGGEAVIEVKANVSYQYEIEEKARTWISIAGTRGLTASTIKLKVAENESQEKREGIVTIRSGELSEKVTIYQSGSVPTLVLTKNEYTVGSDGDEIQVELKSNVDYEVQLPAVDWISESQSRALSSHTHRFTIAANDTYDARTAEITFINKTHNVSEKVKITQVQRDAIVVAQSEYTMPAAGGNLDFTIQSNVEVTVTSSVDWIRQVSTRGLTDKTLRFTVDENTSADSREGTITLSSGSLKQTIKVIQKAKAVFSVSKNEFTVSAAGEHIQVDVTTNGEYSVQLPNVSWITEVSTRGATTKTHTFSIAKNETYDARSAEITFTDKATGTVEKVKVIQMQKNAIVVAQSEYTMPAEGGNLDFTIQSNVEVTATSSVDWIRQVSTRGLTDKTLRFTVDENTSDDSREGTITLSGGDLKQTVKVIQKAKAVFSVSKNEFTVSAAGELVQVDVTTNGEYSVQLPNVSWITEVNTRGATTKTHTFSIAKNETYDARSAEITFTDKATGTVEKVKVTQSQMDALTVSQTEYTVASAGETIDIKYSANVEVTATSSVDWIRQVSTRGLTDKTLRFTVDENTSDDSREGTITLSGGDLKQTIKVIQKAKAVFSVSKNEFTVSAAGEQIQVDVTTNGEYSVQLPNVSWITEVNTRGATTKTHTFSIAKNDTYDARSAEITFTDKATGTVEKVKVTQAQKDALTVSQTEYTVASAGETIDIKYSANVEVTATSSVDWIKQVSTRGLTDKTLRFTVDENTSDDSREGTITLSSGSLKLTIKVTQNGASGTGGGIDDMPTQEWN